MTLTLSAPIFSLAVGFQHGNDPALAAGDQLVLYYRLNNAGEPFNIVAIGQTVNCYGHIASQRLFAFLNGSFIAHIKLHLENLPISEGTVWSCGMRPVPPLIFLSFRAGARLTARRPPLAPSALAGLGAHVLQGFLVGRMAAVKPVLLGFLV